MTALIPLLKKAAQIYFAITSLKKQMLASVPCYLTQTL